VCGISLQAASDLLTYRLLACAAVSVHNYHRITASSALMTSCRYIFYIMYMCVCICVCVLRCVCEQLPHYMLLSASDTDIFTFVIKHSLFVTTEVRLPRFTINQIKDKVNFELK